jgi:hypothetical protein
MPHPLAGLAPALQTLAQYANILPATGQAVEDLQRPDQDEVVDSILTSEETRVDTIAEAPNVELYRSTPGLPRAERHLYRYFMDGSQRSYFIGTAVENERTTPVHLAQIGAAVIYRHDDGNVRLASPDALIKRLLLLVAKSHISDELWNALAAIHGPFDLVDITERDPINGAPLNNADLRSRASGRVNWKMQELEAEARSVPKDRKPGEWMILDGNARLEPIIKTARETIGVAKSFSKQPTFSLRRGSRQAFSIMQLLADLPAAHRTSAFASAGGRVAFWYVRLRDQGDVDYPLMGVVKVELPNPSGQAVDSDLIDLLSQALVAERYVTPHGRDSRWHVHLYPIFQAEQVIKNSMWSSEVIRNSLRWPLRPAQ